VLITGLTGGIATGKSTVAAMLQEAGAVIIDADKIARAVVKKGSKAWYEIVEHFGAEGLLPDGEINRITLGDTIFKDAAKKQVLDDIVHPQVIIEMGKQVEAAKADRPRAVIILDVPLLIESGMHETMSDVILVYTPEHIQLQRLMARDGLSVSDALARIRSQMPIEEKKALATIIIDNSSTQARTRERTLEVYRSLKEKAARTP
jgi:dephospho-CoA kinase